MASELSRLIDDELEKFERRPSADKQSKQKASFSIKAGAHKEASGKSYGWRQKEWWTWKRLTYVILIVVALVGVLMLLPRGSEAAKTALARTNNAAISESGEAVGAGFGGGTGAEASPSTLPIPKEARDNSTEDKKAAPLSTKAPLNHTQPLKVTDSLAVVSPGTFEMAPSPGILENAPAPISFGEAMIGKGQISDSAPSPGPSAISEASAPVPSAREMLTAKAPSSLLKFSLGRRLLDQ